MSSDGESEAGVEVVTSTVSVAILPTDFSDSNFTTLTTSRLSPTPTFHVSPSTVSDESPNRRVGLIIGLVVGLIVAAVLGVLLRLCWRDRRRRSGLLYGNNGRRKRFWYHRSTVHDGVPELGGREAAGRAMIHEAPDTEVGRSIDKDGRTFNPNENINDAIELWAGDVDGPRAFKGTAEDDDDDDDDDLEGRPPTPPRKPETSRTSTDDSVSRRTREKLQTTSRREDGVKGTRPRPSGRGAGLLGT